MRFSKRETQQRAPAAGGRPRQCGRPRSERYFFFVFLRTPLNGFGSAFTSMNLPLASSRFVHVPVIGFLICERFLTAPTRRSSPTSLFFAMLDLLKAAGLRAPVSVRPR